MKTFCRSICGIVVLVSIILALAARGQSSPEAARVTIGGPPNVSLLVTIAEAQGYFNEQNLDVAYKPVQTGKLVQDAVVAGQIPYGAGLDVNVAFLGFHDTDVCALAVLMKKGDDGLIARGDRGIATIADLAGKRIGYLPGTTSDVLLDRLLQSAQLDRARVSLVTMPPPAMQAGIIRGDIDAASVWEPFRENARRSLGDKAFNVDGGKYYTANVLLIGRKPKTLSQDSVESRIIRALTKAAEYARNNPALSQRTVAPMLGLKPEQVEQLWRFYSFGIQPARTAKNDLSRLGSWIRVSQPEYAEKPQPNYDRVLIDGAAVGLAGTNGE